MKRWWSFTVFMALFLIGCQKDEHHHIGNWQWHKTINTHTGIVTLPRSENFILTLEKKGRFASTTDCNQVMGQYVLTENTVKFSNVASTRKFCPGAQEGEYTKQLQNVITFTPIEATSIELSNSEYIMNFIRIE